MTWKNLRVNQVAEMLGISRQMVQKLLQTDPTFPKGFLIGSCRVWSTDDIHAWNEAQKAKV